MGIQPGFEFRPFTVLNRLCQVGHDVFATNSENEEHVERRRHKAFLGRVWDPSPNEPSLPHATCWTEGIAFDSQLEGVWALKKSFSSTLRRKEIGTFTLNSVTPLLFIWRSLELNVTSTSHPNALKDVPTRHKRLNDWDNYVLTNDRSTRVKYKAKIGKRLTPVQNELMVRVRR